MVGKKARRQQADVVPEQADGAFIAAARAGADVDEASQHADERGLAGARFPGDAETVAAFQFKGHVMHGVHAGREGLVEMTDLKKRNHDAPQESASTGPRRRMSSRLVMRLGVEAKSRFV